MRTKQRNEQENEEEEEEEEAEEEAEEAEEEEEVEEEAEEMESADVSAGVNVFKLLGPCFQFPDPLVEECYLGRAHVDGSRSRVKVIRASECVSDLRGLALTVC